MEIQSILQQLGLSKNKGVVYLAALEVGNGSAYEIARKAQLPRTTVHEILQQLMSMGLVGFIVKGRTRIYTAEPPARLKRILQEKERLLESALPELTSRFRTSGRRPSVRLYEGLEGVKTVFEDTLTVRDKILCGILSMADLYNIPGKKFMDGYVKRRIETGIRLRVIRSAVKEVEEVWPTSSKELREVRYAPRDMIFPTTVYFYDKKIVVIGTEKENFGMIIESEDLYTTQKNLFEVLWDVSRIGKKID